MFNRPSDPLAGIIFEVGSQLCALCVYMCVCAHLYGGEFTAECTIAKNRSGVENAHAHNLRLVGYFSSYSVYCRQKKRTEKSAC